MHARAPDGIRWGKSILLPAKERISMKNTGTLRIQAFAARQSSPVEGVTVTVSGNGFTATRLTDAEGNADDVTLTTPACALSLDENNTTQPPYAVCDLVASKTRLPHRPHPGRAGLSRAGDAGPARDDTRHRGDAGHAQRPHRHPTPQPLHRRRRQRPEPVPRLCAAGAGPGHHPEEHHRPSRQARRLGPERHRLVPQLYRQRGVQ